MKSAPKSNQYIGKPCKHGHSGLRYKSRGHCVPCKLAHEALRYRKYPEWQSQRSAKWRAENADREHERFSRWSDANPDKVKAKSDRRIAAERAAEGFHTKSDIDAIFESQGGRCAYFVFCGSILKEDFNRDHKVPLCKGGSNWPSNIQLTCPSCNWRKGRKLPTEFEAELVASASRALVVDSASAQFSRP